MAVTGVEKVEESAELQGRRRTSASRAIFGDLVQFLEFIGVIAASVIVALGYHSLFLHTEVDFQKYTAAGIIGATGLTALLRRDGYYDFDQLLSLNGIIRVIISRWMLIILGLLAFGFALKVSDSFSRFWLGAWSGSVLTFIFLTRWASATIARRMIRDGGAFARHIALVGSGDLALQFSETISAEQDGVSIIGVFEPDIAMAEENKTSFSRYDLNELEQAARNGAVDDIVIAAPHLEKDTMGRLIRRLSALPVSISICPTFHWLDHRGGAVSTLAGVSVLSLYRRPLEGWGSVLKCIEDVMLGIILLIIASPILLTIAIAIKLQDKGPALFVQKRHGFNNSVFKIYKFRTMTVAEDGDVVTQAQVNDPRITPLGKFLRRYSLDELPQLINVVMGHMSLVGPRPHAMAHNHQYAQLIENYSGRHNVKPGITGWAQVNGYRGETSENELMEERVRFDLAYIDNWSIWFDLKILAMTFIAVVFPKNAF